MDDNRITLSPSGTARRLGVLAALLVLASVAGQYVRSVLRNETGVLVDRFLNLDREHNLPTFFSILLLLFASLLLAVIAVLDGRRRNAASRWGSLSAVFLFMAYDEGFSVHELLNAPVRALLGEGRLGMLYYAWVLPGLAIVALLALFYLRFLRSLPAETRKTFLMAALVYIGGALGVELIGGCRAELCGTQDRFYRLTVILEEGLELTGVILFIRGLLTYLANVPGGVQIRFAGDNDGKSPWLPGERLFDGAGEHISSDALRQMAG